MRTLPQNLSDLGLFQERLMSEVSELWQDTCRLELWRTNDLRHCASLETVSCFPIGFKITPKRVQADVASAYVGSAATLEETTDDVCEFDE